MVELSAALQTLRSVCTSRGILAGADDSSNYRAVWTRDAVVCGLAGLAAGDDTVIEALAASLETLGSRQGPDGQIPSNVDPQTGRVSYGGLAGRVDTIPWYVIGACALALSDYEFDLEPHLPRMRRALDLLGVWEFNRRGYVWVPEGGDWADEYILHGYVLYDQLLRLWALRLHTDVVGDDTSADAAAMLTRGLLVDFLPDGNDESRAYHRLAYRRRVERHGPANYWLAALSPGGYTERFDGWSNAIAVLLGLGDVEIPLRAGEEIRGRIPAGLVPAFWPPIKESDAEWPRLREAAAIEFRNEPGEYHNGGLWPVVAGFWGLALLVAGWKDAAQDVFDCLQKANGSAFPEYLHAQTSARCGTTPCAWSAAGELLLASALDDGPPNFLHAGVAK